MKSVIRIHQVRWSALIVLGFVSLGLQAQKVRLGGRVMPQLVHISNSEDKNSDVLNPEPTAGIGLGISVSYLIHPKWEVEFDALFSKQGQSYKLADTTGQRVFRSYDLKLNYIKFPLLLKYRIALDDQSVLALYAGPQLSLLAGADEVISDTITVSYSGTGISTTNKYTSVDFSAVVGAEVQFAINDKLILYTGLRFEYGLRDVENKNVVWAKDGFTDSGYYESYYGPSIYRDTPRTTKSNSIVFGAMLGVSYILNTTRNPNDYYW